MSLQQLREKIVNEIPISDLIERYGVHLVRKGNNLYGVCPFHDDTNPSMSVVNDKRMYKCFSCGAGHSHFDFVMNLQSMEFIEAMKDICDKFGIDFDSYTNKKEKSKEFIYAEKLLKVASTIYFQSGRNLKPEQYLDFLKNRHLSDEIADLYQLGFAPKKNSVYDYVCSLPKKDRNEILQTALKIGIIKHNKDNGSHYDTFRERIMFPIWDHYGKVIGFTSRRIHEYQHAKYMNSIESFIFNKRNLLYGLHLAKSFIRKRDSVIVVEGNMDQIATYKKGFENSVAIMGTSLGDNSLRTLKSMTKNIYFALDNDEAGYKASQRTNRQFLEHGILPKFVDLSPHKDPDDFLDKEGTLAFQDRIDNAQAFIDYEFNKLLPKRPIEILDEKLNLLKQAFDIVSPLGNDLNANERLVSWAKKLGLESSKESILDNYGQFLKDSKSSTFQPKITNQNTPQEEPPAYDEDYMANFVEDSANGMPSYPEEEDKISKTEETLLLAIIEHPDCLEYDEMTDLLDFMQSDRVKEYILNLKNLIFEIDQREFKNFALSSSSEYGLEEIIKKGIIKNKGIQLEKEKAVKIINDLRKKLIKENLREKRQLLKLKRSEIKTQSELTELLKEIHDIEKKLFTLK
ncbi:DNA primase [Halobacteriovorax sp. BALOs_7]|uniref:DNA primase n=1 Tax=Halobacteriovorax sp. BALOs_7 TaxID=2109558 RepID=UPI000EA20E73|nr:DNA primase [Halobacteriovorax sp. BALOs_7]AYF43347.1 DNA primase [Halobacteriovorax sp. BALOs_7]